MPYRGSHGRSESRHSRHHRSPSYSRSRSPPSRKVDGRERDGGFRLGRSHKKDYRDGPHDRSAGYGYDHGRPRGGGEGGGGGGNFRSRREEQTRMNQLREEERMKDWVSQEDVFVLAQAKKKAQIRVKEGRARPIDWLVVTLRVIDPTRNPFDDEINDADLDLLDPEGIFERLNADQLDELEDDINEYLSLEVHEENQDFWKTMQIVCADFKKRRDTITSREDRAMSSVAADIHRLLSPKTYEELCSLEAQIRAKLDSNEPIDTDYWNQLLRSLSVFKAKAQLRAVHGEVVKQRLAGLLAQQKEEADNIRTKLEALAPPIVPDAEPENLSAELNELDPTPLLKLHPQDKATLEVLDEEALLHQAALDRRRIMGVGFVPLRQRRKNDRPLMHIPKQPGDNSIASLASRLAPTSATNDEFSQATKALYERELARGVSENEEIFTGEETIPATKAKPPSWAAKYRPRKPRYFNRVQMGYEWNKYNQTHYDYDNLPPRVVMGYKFNIFYPELIDKTRAPTYKIERENGRKRGQSFAPAGEEDTCLIRFIAGPPYEDIAFRIVDKEWDFSAKRGRGFRSKFEKGILQLHFQFKKIFYRK